MQCMSSVGSATFCGLRQSPPSSEQLPSGRAELPVLLPSLSDSPLAACMYGHPYASTAYASGPRFQLHKESVHFRVWLSLTPDW